MIRRAVTILALAAGLSAADSPLDAPWSFQALGGADLSFLPDRPATAVGGVTASFQGIDLAGDRVDYRLVQLPLLASVTVASAILSPSPAPGARVLVDTRKSTLPKLPLKGLLTPVRLTITRQEHDGPAVRWMVDLEDLGQADLQLQVKDGWAWHRIWAQDAHLRIEAPIVNRTLGAFRLVDAVFNGREDPGDGTGKLAKIDRFGPGEQAPTADATAVGGVEASSIHLTLDAQDRISASTRGVTRMRGTGLTDLGHSP